jgi:selT/selW/selH-like putative selenoprotein
MQSFIIVFLITNMLTGMISSTGAFEVSLGNQTVFSKLKMGRMPEVDELIRNVKMALKA